MLIETKNSLEEQNVDYATLGTDTLPPLFKDYKAELRGNQKYRVYTEMLDNDGTIKAVLRVLTLPIMSADWFIEAASDDEQDQLIKRFVEDNLFEGMTVTWQETLRQILDHLAYGFMAFEQLYADYVFEGKQLIGLHKLAPRMPSTITDFENATGETGLVQIDPETNKQVFIPINKALIVTNEKKGDDWRGTSVLRSAYRHWYIKDKLYMIDAVKSERQGLGVPMVEKTVDSKWSNKEQQDAAEIIENIRAFEKGYLIKPYGYKVSFLDMNAGSTKDQFSSIEHHDRQISKSVLAQFLELGASSTGSYALSADQTDMFMLSEIAIATTIRDALQKYVVERLVAYNFPVSIFPQIQFGKIGKADVTKVVEAMTKLVAGGIVSVDDSLEEYSREVLELPVKDTMNFLDEGAGDQYYDEAMTDLLETEALTEEEPLDFAGESEELTDEQLAQASELAIDAYKGAAGKPLSEEHKQKIKEALKRYWDSKGRKGKKSSGSKKSQDPQTVKDKAEIAKLKQELADFRTEGRRKALELKAKGEKLSAEDNAKAQLELLNKSDAISKRIRELNDQITQRKAAEKAVTEAVTAVKTDDKKASFRTILTKLSEAFRKA